MNKLTSINKVLIFASLLFTFMLGMVIAFYIGIGFEPCPYLAAEQRLFNYTEKDCYTKCDVELIIFGKVLDYE